MSAHGVAVEAELIVIVLPTVESDVFVPEDRTTAPVSVLTLETPPDPPVEAITKVFPTGVIEIFAPATRDMAPTKELTLRTPSFTKVIDVPKGTTLIPSPATSKRLPVR